MGAVVTDLAKVKDGWDRAAREDAMFNILTLPDKKDHGWDAEDFFRTGVTEIDRMMDTVGPHLDKQDRALDFGCGVGRATQALAEHFEKADGCDLSEEMVEQARRHNWHGDAVEYRVSSERLPYPDRSFDLVYTMIVLQHLPPDRQADYVAEFARVLRRGGVAAFHVYTGQTHDHPQPWLAMHGVTRDTVVIWLKTLGLELLEVQELDENVGNDLRFVVRK